MYWSAGALLALLCGDTVTLSNEDKFPESNNKVYKIKNKNKNKKVSVDLYFSVWE